MMDHGPNATYQTTRSLALWFLRKRFFKGFYHTWAWWPSWSCDPHPANKLLFPRTMEAPHEIWLWLAQRQWFCKRRSLKMVDGLWMDNGPWLYYKLTNEPKGSGELKILTYRCHYRKIWTMWFYRAVMHLKVADRMANNTDPDQTAPSGTISMWSGSTLFAQTCLSQKLRIITVPYIPAISGGHFSSWLYHSVS